MEHKVGIAVLAALVLPAVVLATDTRTPEVRVYEVKQQGDEIRYQGNFLGFEASVTSGGAVATGDVDGDGNEEIIVVAGPGEQPEVRVYDGAGVLENSFQAFPSNITMGLTVDAGDLNNDGTDEIVIGTQRGGGPMVRVFNNEGEAQFTPGFFAYDAGFRGGVNVAVGNVDGRGGEEIITGAGPGGGPHVRVFNRFGEYTGMDFFPFASTDKGGVSVATANVDGGREDEIVMAIHSFGAPLVKVYKTDTNKTIVGEFYAYDQNFMGGVNVAGGDIDRDGVDEVITAVRQAGGPHVRFFEGHGESVNNVMAYEDEFRGGVSVAVGNVDGDSKPELITIPQRKIVEGRLDLFKYIDINLTEQKLTAYQNGSIDNEFLISSGVARYPTPQGDFAVTAKIPVKDYEWSYGEEHPDNYDIKDVPNNLRFLPTYYLHNAYWHNNFGHPMSHGCVNINLENSAWIYNWADVGTPVLIHE